MTATAAQDAQAGRAHGGLYLLELNLSGGLQRLCTWGHAVDFMGHTWSGVNRPLNLSAVQDSTELAYPAMDVTLSLGNSAHLALALANPAEYRGRSIRIWLATLDDQLRPLPDPEQVWGGRMEQINLSTGDGVKDHGTVTLRCECTGRDNRAAQTLRLMHAQHVARHPGDTGLSRIEALVGKPSVWLSKRFQEQKDD